VIVLSNSQLDLGTLPGILTIHFKMGHFGFYSCLDIFVNCAQVGHVSDKSINGHM